MAKSLFEPKRVPKYTENIIKPTTGLQAAPVPVRQQSATRAVPKTQAIPASAQQVSAPAPAPVAPPAPAPTPAPPVVSETSAFFFDGATKLTSSIDEAAFGTLSVGFTITPGWNQEDTGSWTVMSIGIPDDPAAAIMNVRITRTSGSTGYTDSLVSELASGSIYVRSTQRLVGLSPTFYSGSTGRDNVYIRTYISAGELINLRYTKKDGNTTKIENSWVSNSTNTTGSYGENGRYIFYLREFNNRREDYRFVLGGLASGSGDYFSGSLDNFYMSRIQQLPGESVPYSFVGSDAKYVTRHYRFEGNTNPQKGDVLYVDGTETYVSSSI